MSGLQQAKLSQAGQARPDQATKQETFAILCKDVNDDDDFVCAVMLVR